ncbi:PocR ligand-binding domain-containing protein [Faecalicatena sp. AGMB00832]|uniref:PocR ligand-binding domain-containing protein n=1 Tax=Faecalicatena faecalis TaxID=2726362 RepID=A0ABS6D902_9FIRM|nr:MULTISPECIES: PocR ligand-binding domain-containing protein [Faecalicatena]MBU3878075.1 PocR ligand-binding domain-containing protein [Faecalicatena faecalis]MCI6466662.1 PocR ligand-binding domain-containing protein [Faecalicatena sp.]MDY5620636.1 PocR ligand-binding domain-containing protein [Lachnospiraceae bacterium]
MISTFNLTKLNSLLKDFFTITQIRITVFDETFRELASFPEQIAPICQLLRTDEKADMECRRCDAIACETAARQRTSYTYRCHAGLTESIAPLYMGNLIIGYLLFGHVFSYSSHEEGWTIISDLCRSYQVDQEQLKQACWERPLISENYIDSASHILQAVASYLCLERMAILGQKELPVLIDEYIMEHYTEDIDVRTICEHFKIGKTSLYEIADQNYGTGIAAHIRSLRIEKAKSLLTAHPEMNISEIASACGFNDYNYFITIFKRMTQMSPKQYRQTSRKDFL